MKIYLFICIITLSNCLGAQNNFETEYLKCNYHGIIDSTLYPKTHDDYFWGAMARNKMGDVLSAVKMLENGSEQFPDYTPIEKQLALCYFEAGQYNRATPLLIKYINFPDHLLALINIYDFQNKHREALNMLQLKVQTDSSNVPILKLVAAQHYAINEIDSAIYYYKKILALNANDQVTAYKLANLYFKSKRYTRCQRVCRTFLENDSTNIRFLKLQGMCAFNQKRYISSSKIFKTLVELNDTTDFIYKHLGISSFEILKYTEANEYLQKAYDLDTNDYEVCFYLGRSYYHTPNQEKGLFYLNRTEELITPKSEILSAIYMEKTYFYEIQERFGEMIECYKKSYALTKNPRIIFSMATAYHHKVNDYDSALVYYQQFVDLVKDLPASGDNVNVTAISLRSLAEQRMTEIKESVFFNGTQE